MIELTIRQPGSAPMKATLPNGAYLIGAGRNSHIRLDQPDISGRHAQLVVTDGAINIMDLGSSNGTFINKSRDPLFANQNFAILPGTVIRLGKNVELLVEKAELKVPQAEQAEEKKAPAEKKRDLRCG